MVIIRRNPDGSIASQEGQPTQSHPALATKMGMQALQDTGRAVPPLMNEIATKINNAKDKPRKLKVLKEHDSVPLRQVLKGAFDPSIEWLLPKGDVPYRKNEAPIGTESAFFCCLPCRDVPWCQGRVRALFVPVLFIGGGMRMTRALLSL